MKTIRTIEGRLIGARFSPFLARGIAHIMREDLARGIQTPNARTRLEWRQYARRAGLKLKSPETIARAYIERNGAPLAYILNGDDSVTRIAKLDSGRFSQSRANASTKPRLALP